MNEVELQKLLEGAKKCEFEFLVFPKRFYMMIRTLSEKKRLLFYDAIFDYYFTGEEPQLSIKDYSFWLSIKPDLDRKKQNVRNARRNKNGIETEENQIKIDSKTIQKRFKNDSKINDDSKINCLNDRDLSKKNKSETTSETASDYIYIKDKRLNIKDKRLNIKDKKNETYKEQRAKVFAPPSPDEVTEFFKDNFFNSNPDEFIDYYTANGWMVGKTKMKDWKAAARNWERRQKEFSNNSIGNELRTNTEKKAVESNPFDGWDWGKNEK